jgi:hypothetical protein
MTNVSIIPELTDAEASLTRLCEAIQRKTKDKEMREEYYTLTQQACIALNKIRAYAETSDWFSSGEMDRLLDKLKR